MNRREFLKGFAVSLIVPASALAQTPNSEAIDAVKDKISSLLEKTFEFESVDPENVEWIEGISDGTACTF